MKTLFFIFVVAATSLSTQAQSLKDRDDSYAFLNKMQKHHEQTLFAAQFAANNAMDPGVRSLSRDLVQTTQSALNEIKEALSRLPSQLTPAIDPSATQSLASTQANMSLLPINSIQNIVGTEFDKKYAETMLEYQKKGAEIAQKTTAEIVNPIIKDLARKTSESLEAQQKSFSQMITNISATIALRTGSQ